MCRRHVRGRLPKCVFMADESSSFYKRTRPPSCVSFTSCQGKKYFRQALEEENMESYFPLAMQFLTQSEPAFCGLGTLAMVLNALEIDPMRKWKGVWYVSLSQLSGDGMMNLCWIVADRLKTLKSKESHYQNLLV